MKQTILVLLLILFSYYLISNYAEKNFEIPDDAIRIRILANSDTEYDQFIKNNVKDTMQGYMYNLLGTTNNVEIARHIIIDNLENIESTIETTLHALDYNLPYNINFGLNYFPNKKYKGINYEAGYYQSLLITLGEGKGDNWWCVLFPPLCLVEAEEDTEVEYKSFVKELLDKYV